MEIRQRRRLVAASVAAAVILGGGAAAALPAFADDFGTITGQLTDAGAPVSGAWVTVYDTNFVWIDSTSTDGSGAFTIDNVVPGAYKLQFDIGGYRQWSVQKPDFSSADIITVDAGSVVTVNESVRPYGQLSGHVTRADGTAVAGANVTAYSFAGEWAGSTLTGADGGYTLTYLGAGDYRVQFQEDNSPVQYANGRTSWLAADPITIAAGATTTLDQTLLPYATLTGTITAADGGPAAWAQVSVQGPDTSQTVTTDHLGQYTVNVWPGTYRVQVSHNSLTQWIPGATTIAEAGQYTLPVGVTVLDETLLARGTVAGRLTKADGSAVPWTTVSVHGATGVVYGMTDDNGEYSIEVFPGTHKVAFDTPYGRQWAFGRASAVEADPVTVVAGEVTTVNDSLAPFGSVAVTAVDAISGEQLTTFCAYTMFSYECTDSGTVTLSQLLPGSHDVTATADDGIHLWNSVQASVTSGETTPVTIELDRGATVTAMITDHQSGAPVANACFELIPVAYPINLGGHARWCSDGTGAATATGVTPGKYKVYVRVSDGVHGDQWLANGTGTGQIDKAVTINVASGATVTLPPVRLDEAGSITGVITDEATGEPVTNASVGILTWDFGSGEGESILVDANGRYTVSNLGPYQWTLYFSAFGYASEFSGDSATRNGAKTIKVKKGRTVTHDVQLGLGTTVTGQIVDPDGTAATSARLTFVNAESGDYIGVADIWMSEGATYTSQLSPQRVKIQYYADVNGVRYSGWVGGTSFSDASAFTIPSTPNFQLDVTVSTLDIYQ